MYRELQSRRWHAEDLQPLCAKLGEEQTGKTLVAVAALEQVGLITAAEKRRGKVLGAGADSRQKEPWRCPHPEMSGGTINA